MYGIDAVCGLLEIPGPSFESHDEDCDIFGSVLGPPVDGHPHKVSGYLQMSKACQPTRTVKLNDVSR